MPTIVPRIESAKITPMSISSKNTCCCLESAKHTICPQTWKHAIYTAQEDTPKPFSHYSSLWSALSNMPSSLQYSRTASLCPHSIKRIDNPHTYGTHLELQVESSKYAIRCASLSWAGSRYFRTHLGFKHCIVSLLDSGVMVSHCGHICTYHRHMVLQQLILCYN